jgi:hypothetical protein
MSTMFAQISFYLMIVAKSIPKGCRTVVTAVNGEIKTFQAERNIQTLGSTVAPVIDQSYEDISATSKAPVCVPDELRRPFIFGGIRHNV